MDVSKLLRGPEPLRTGVQPPVGGRIYDVDPAAVARLKKLMAKKADDRPVRHAPVVVKRQREKEIAMQKQAEPLTDERAIKAHLEIYQAGKPLTAAAEWAGVPAATLRDRWRDLRAPITRTIKDRAWPGPAVVSREPAEEETPAAVAATVAVNGRESVTTEARELVEPGKPAAMPPALMQVFTLLQQLDDVEVKVSGALSVEIEVLF